MSSPNHSHSIQIEFRFDGGAPTGKVRLAGGEAREFSGWIGLVCCIETLVDTSRAPLGSGS